MNSPAALPVPVEDYQDTDALRESPYFRKVVDTIECPKLSIRLMSLPPGDVMKTHTDDECGYEDGVFRLHVPVVTNPDVHFVLNEERVIMGAGECWYTNVNFPHSVANKGTERRVHLVMECIRNEWTDKVFDQAGYNFELEYDLPTEYPPEVLRMMIQSLEAQDHPLPAAQSLIEQYKAQLAELGEVSKA
jgi:quercetin dioxygenase-like cupin family protein